MLSNNGHDENGRYSGGRAGDQNGSEWQIVPWYRYSGGWQYCIHHPDANVRQLITQLATEAAHNDNIGYDQNERYTFWQQLKASGFHPANITTPCESDCSAGVAAIVKAVGYLTMNDRLKSVNSDCYTGNIRQALQNAGFEVYTDSKYLNGDEYLCAGDFLLKEYNHICTVVTNGSHSEGGEDQMIIDEYRNKTRISHTCCKFMNVNVDELAIRMYADENAPTARWSHLNKGNPLLVTGYSPDRKWAKIQFDYGADGGEGWVWSEYIS